jgi:hypothetical protein
MLKEVSDIGFCLFTGNVIVQWSCPFLDAFAKLRKATFSFVMSALLSVRMEKTQLPMNGFSWNLMFEYFSKMCRERSSSINIGQE